jgi:lipid-binding SYLF domain-containing protein
VVSRLDLHPPAHPPEAPEGQRLPVDEQYVLCVWSVDAVAGKLACSFDDAADLLEAAYAQGRIQIMGNGMFAGVACDGRWLVVEGRANLTRATREWQALRAMERQFEPPPE